MLKGNLKPLYPTSVIKNTPNALNTDTLNTKRKYTSLILYNLLRLNQKITSKITHIPIDLTL